MLSLSCYENAIGESGSGKTESTNFLLHHLTALSQKGSQGCGVEQTILSAGPVLEVRSPIIFHFLLFFWLPVKYYVVRIIGTRRFFLVNRFNHQRQLVSYF